ncbi:hypothetical protein N9M78_00810 [Alphaproteobacteria bacterium]|nr:hypothetical protein [Alphaproteobacteria bacterium]
MQKNNQRLECNHLPKVRLLTVVWGREYIKTFMKRCLLSLLADNNLPSFVKRVETEVVILTTANSKKFFLKNTGFQALEKLCQVRFIEIDDLINPMYGFVLTLAYARGVIDAGEEQVNTHFVFLNSDFILSNGSLDRLAELILCGETVVLAPSLRVSESQFYARHSFPKNHQSISDHFDARKLVDSAFRTLHPTVLAKTVNSPGVYHTHPNQHYWRVNPDVLLGVHYLIFMMVIKPSRIMKSAESFVDYSFIQQLNPEAKPCALNDSDKFFMIETQDFHRELEFVKKNKSWTPSLTEKYIKNWIMREQIEVSKHQIIFRRGDDQTNLLEAKQSFEKYIANANGRVKKCWSYKTHPHWLGTLMNYLSVHGKLYIPPELPKGITLRAVKTMAYNNHLLVNGYLMKTTLFFKSLISIASQNVVKTQPEFRPSEYYYAETIDIIAKIKESRKTGARILFAPKTICVSEARIIETARINGYEIRVQEEKASVSLKGYMSLSLAEVIFLNCDPVCIVQYVRYLLQKRWVNSSTDIVSYLYRNGTCVPKDEVQIQRYISVLGFTGALVKFLPENLDGIQIKHRESRLIFIRYLFQRVLEKEYYFILRFGFLAPVICGIASNLLTIVNFVDKLMLYFFDREKSPVISEQITFRLKGKV